MDVAAALSLAESTCTPTSGPYERRNRLQQPRCVGWLGVTEFGVPRSRQRLAPVRKCGPITASSCALGDARPHRGMAFLIRPARRDQRPALSWPGHDRLKLYNQYKLHARGGTHYQASHGTPCAVLVHAAYLPAPEHQRQQPLTSHGADFAVASEKYPDALLIHAHIGGGGDWEWTLRALRDASPNVYVDVSGSNLDAGQVEMAVAELGAKRVLFGTDGTMAGSVGKVLDADLTEEEQDLIFWRNAARLLAEQGLAPLNMPRGDAQCSST